MTLTYQTNTYTYLYACAKWVRNQPIPQESPGFALYRRMTHLTFLALTYEAFLNHCGFLTVPWWQIAERTMSTEAKLAVVLDVSKLSFDDGRRPMQSLTVLMKLRNEMAHGKTASIPFVEGTVFHPNNLHPKWLKAIKVCDEDRLQEDVVEFVTQVYNALGFNEEHPTPFGLMGITKSAP